MSETTRPAAPAVRSYAPITKVKTLQELFDHPGLKSRMTDIVPKHLDADRLLRTFMNATLKTPGLAKVSPLSMLGCAMTIGYLGLEPNTPLGLIYLIPFEVNQYNRATKEFDYVRTDVNAIVGYEGFIDLIDRGGRVKDIDCQLIWPGDSWENERGSSRHFRHVERFPRPANATEPDFAYMFARTTNGGEYLELMSRADVQKVRNMSQGYRSAMAALEKSKLSGYQPPKAYTEAPWIKHAAAMWRKSPLRAGQKWLPGRTPELAAAASLDEAGDAGRVRFDQVLEAEAVAEGAWEVPASEAETEEQPPERPPLDRPTQVQAKAVDTPAQEDAKPPRQQRKAPAKQAAAEPPADFDERNPPPNAEPAAPVANEAPSPEAEPSEGTGKTAAPAPEDDPNPSSGGPAFEAWLLDVNGDPVTDDPYTDPVAFSTAFVALVREHPEANVSLREQNADGIADVLATEIAPAIHLLNSLREAPIEERPEPVDDGDEAPGVIVVTLAMDRGKALVKDYLDRFKAEVTALVAGNFLDFIELNRPEMAKVPASTISLCLKALVQKSNEIGVAIPPDLGPSLLTRPGAAPALTETQTLDPTDRQSLDNRKRQLEGCVSIDEVEMLAKSEAVVRLGERLQRSGKTEAIAELKAAFDAKRAALRTPAG
jgi:recombination protein RecT